MQKYTKISAFKSEQDLSVRYIGKEKFHNSSKETALLEEFTDKLVIHPEMFPADKYRKNNEGNFRAYELYHYRIFLSNKITVNQLLSTIFTLAE